VILLDANILMYAAGAAHSNKAPSAAYLRRVAGGEVDAALDAEALQEILHRYRAIGRWHQGRQVYDAARRLFSTIIPVDADVLDIARRWTRTRLSVLGMRCMLASRSATKLWQSVVTIEISIRSKGWLASNRQASTSQ